MNDEQKASVQTTGLWFPPESRRRAGKLAGSRFTAYGSWLIVYCSLLVVHCSLLLLAAFSLGGSVKPNTEIIPCPATLSLFSPGAGR